MNDSEGNEPPLSLVPSDSPWFRKVGIRIPVLPPRIRQRIYGAVAPTAIVTVGVLYFTGQLTSRRDVAVALILTAFIVVLGATHTIARAITGRAVIRNALPGAEGGMARRKAG
ncbi:hypothetical protein HRW07_04730 [Streptomyces lunaelactis]|uniref:hypothetical protein n=1 Tax=Streptomyces lunaelactis TaxID=1535768 RepID=UPI0015845ADA|nr:hypothetical protein [Streptomyces lunaelactis]NUL02559.1 hypothetical protein [Streptomyces lunaelactis]